MINTVLKIQGKKRRVAEWAVSEMKHRFPDASKLVVPFVGSGSIALNYGKRAWINDRNRGAMSLYQAMLQGRLSVDDVRRHLVPNGHLLAASGVGAKESHYYVVRDRFNDKGDPLDYLFLNRTCFNGLVRFNKNEKFNVPFCRNENKMTASYIDSICRDFEATQQALIDWVDFATCLDFRDTLKVWEDDPDALIYADPPYTGRDTNYGAWWDDEAEQDLFDVLSGGRAQYVVSSWDSGEGNPSLTKWLDIGCTVKTRELQYMVGRTGANRPVVSEVLIMKPPSA